MVYERYDKTLWNFQKALYNYRYQLGMFETSYTNNLLI